VNAAKVKQGWIMSDKANPGPREWQPDWSQGDLDEIERLKAELREAKPIVRRLRKELGLSQAEAAEILETTQSNVSKIEAKADPPLSVLRRLVESRGGRLALIATFGDGREISLG
jgi:DNA-binding XRE family transcriptional regulator